MYCFYGNSSWYINGGALFGGGPLLGGSVIGGSTVKRVQVELLVRAHNCYTLGCCVDGISEVLLVVRQWVPNLISLKLFSLVVSTY